MLPQARLGFIMFMVVWLTSHIIQAQGPSTPIPNPLQPADQQIYFGHPADPQPITSRSIPEHPFMAGDASSNIHNDAYMSDTYTHAGPLGVNPEVLSVDLGGVCATMVFDSQGHIITACLSLKSGSLFLLDATTLEILDTLELPYTEVSLDDLEFPPGSYFYLDDQERIMIPVVGNEIWQVGVQDNTLQVENTFPLQESLPEDAVINSVLPDFNGLLWFTTLNGVVGIVDPNTQFVITTTLDGESISNSLAVDETGGVYIVSDTALYRFDADETGQPTVTWREEYDRGTEIKPGQVSQGSGTTPTLMGENYVTITDNAAPQMHVLVYQRAQAVDGERLMCSVPVFPEGRSATENSLIATDTSIIVENNYGYIPTQNALGNLSEPGMARIDISPEGTCEVIWESAERVPNAVTKLSLNTGLIYAYTRDEGNMTTGAWLLSAISFATGETVWERYVGTGKDFNSNYAAVYLGQDGTAYAGVTSGIVAVRDTE